MHLPSNVVFAKVLLIPLNICFAFIIGDSSDSSRYLDWYSKMLNKAFVIKLKNESASPGSL